MLLLLGFVGVVPRLYVRVPGEDAEVLYDWGSELNADKQFYAAFVALHVAAAAVPTPDARSSARQRDGAAFLAIRGAYFDRLQARWTKPAPEILKVDPIPTPRAFASMLDVVLRDQMRALKLNEEFAQGRDVLRNMLLAREVLGRTALERFVDKVIEGLSDPFSQYPRFESLVLTGRI